MSTIISLKCPKFSFELRLEEHGLIKFSKLFRNTFTNDSVQIRRLGGNILLACHGMRINNWEIVSEKCTLCEISNLIQIRHYASLLLPKQFKSGLIVLNLIIPRIESLQHN